MPKHFLLFIFLATGKYLMAQETYPITLCVIDNGELKNVSAVQAVGTATITVTVNDKEITYTPPGKPAPLPGYAEGQEWYINNKKIKFKNKTYRKYGLPREIGAGEVEKIGDHEGVGIYGEKGGDAYREYIYIPVSIGCEFQPYGIK